MAKHPMRKTKTPRRRRRFPCQWDCAAAGVVSVWLVIGTPGTRRSNSRHDVTLTKKYGDKVTTRRIDLRLAATGWPRLPKYNVVPVTGSDHESHQVRSVLPIRTKKGRLH